LFEDFSEVHDGSSVAQLDQEFVVCTVPMQDHVELVKCLQDGRGALLNSWQFDDRLVQALHCSWGIAIFVDGHIAIHDRLVGSKETKRASKAILAGV
jgi:hypothetical protein